MSNINAQTIINQVMAAHAIAPDDGTEYITFKTSERGTHRIINDKAHLQRFADAVRKNAATFGGGLIREAKTAPAVSYASKTISLYKQLIEDKDWYAALQLADEKLNPLFYFGNDGKAHIQVAQIPLEADSRLVSVLNEDGTWSVIDPVSMMAMHGHASKNKRSRDAQIENAMQRYSKGTQEAKENMFAKAYAKPVDQSATRAQWLADHGIVDDAAIEARIEANAAQDVAQIVAQAVAVSAISEAMAPAAEDAQELVTCEAGESEAHTASTVPAWARACEVGSVETMGVFQSPNAPYTPVAISTPDPMAWPSGEQIKTIHDAVDALTEDESIAIAKRMGKKIPYGMDAKDAIKQEHPDDISHGLAGDIWNGKDWAIAPVTTTVAISSEPPEPRPMESTEAGKPSTLDDFLAVQKEKMTCVRFSQTHRIMHKRVQYDGHILKAHEFIERIMAEGLELHIKQENKIADMSRLQYFRADNEEQMAHEKRQKEAGKKDVYYAGNIELTYTEYLYAQHIACVATSEAPAAPDVAPIEVIPTAVESPEITAPEAEPVPVVEIEDTTPAMESQPEPVATVVGTEDQDAPDTLESFTAGDGVSYELCEAIERASSEQVQALTDAQFSKLYGHLENWNFHTENYLLEALRLGDESIITDMRQVIQDQKEAGYLRSDIYERRMAIFERMNAAKQANDSPLPPASTPDDHAKFNIRAKSGAWFACVYMIGTVYGLRFDAADGSHVCTTYATHAERMQALEAMARATTPPDTPPDGGQPIATVDAPTEAPASPVAECTPDTPVAVSSASDAPLHPRNIVPVGGLHIVDDAFEAWTYQNQYPSGTRYGFVMYLGKSAKPWKYYGYHTEEKRDEGFERHAAEAREIAAIKAKRKAEDKAKAEQGHGLQVGDVVRSSWGYDQTNVNHYQITKLIGKCTVEVRELAGIIDRERDMSGNVAPVWGEFIGEAMRRTVDKYGQVNILREKFGRASKIEPVAIVHGVRCYASTDYSSYA